MQGQTRNYEISKDSHLRAEITIDQKEAPRERSTLRREIRALDVVISPIPLRAPHTLAGFGGALLRRYRDIARFVRPTVPFSPKAFNGAVVCPLRLPGILLEILPDRSNLALDCESLL